jgi:hypothetical protein
MAGIHLPLVHIYRRNLHVIFAAAMGSRLENSGLRRFDNGGYGNAVSR